MEFEDGVRWKGYEFMEKNKKKIYSVELPKSKFNELLEQFKAWNGRQRDFYFQFVNPYKLSENLKGKKINSLKKN